MTFRLRRRFLLLAALLLLTPLSILLHPRARASVRAVSGFSPHPIDGRVFFEPGADDFAERFARALPAAVEAVETTHSLPFKSPFRVYVCASHESFSRRLSLPENTPVRGLAFLWDVWLSPKSFDFNGLDTHRQSLTHELSHLHMGQYLGWIGRAKNVPTWFAEGLADIAADTGFEIATRSMAVDALSRQHYFLPDTSGHLPFPRRPTDYGLSAPLLHAQSRLFVEYLRAQDRVAFSQFVSSVLSGASFETSFEEAFRTNVVASWDSFVTEISSHAEGSGASNSDRL